jgi:hypothetical protein
LAGPVFDDLHAISLRDDCKTTERGSQLAW